MNASYYRSQLDRKNKARADAEKKAGDLRSKETSKRADAAKARAAAGKSKSTATINSKLRNAVRYEEQALKFGKEADSWSVKAAKYGKEAADLEVKLAKAERSERETAERARQREQKVAEQRAAAERKRVEGRLAAAEKQVSTALRELRAPKPEKLRVLLLGASSMGDLRVAREQARIRKVVELAHHRDLVELDARAAATTEDLLDGMIRFRPHVVHFSGHSNTDLLVFEKDVDAPHKGAITTARAFARAVTAADEPPLLVLLNSCHSAAQIDKLVDVIPFAIGMSDTIGDEDAITYAAQFYAAVANGQSIESAHASGQAAVEINGLPDYDLPTLACAPNVDPRATFLVKPPQ